MNDISRKEEILKAEESIRILAKEYSKMNELSDLTRNVLEQLNENKNALSVALNALNDTNQRSMEIVEASKGALEASVGVITAESQRCGVEIDGMIQEAINGLNSATSKNEEIRLNLLTTLVSLGQFDKDFQLFKKDYSHDIDELKAREAKNDAQMEENAALVNVKIEDLDQRQIKNYDGIVSNILSASEHSKSDHLQIIKNLTIESKGVVESNQKNMKLLLDETNTRIERSSDDICLALKKEYRIIAIAIATSALALLGTVILLLR